MLKKCAILGLIVLSVGGIALAWGHYRMQTERPQIGRQGPPKDSLRSPEYVNKFGRWYELTPDEQTRLVLELDNDRRTKAPQQLAQEQRDRLLADVDKLAAGEVVPGEIVNYLYGPDWQAETAQYKEQAERMRSIQAAAMVCVSFGAGLFALSIVAAAIRLMVRAIRRTRTTEPESESEASSLVDTRPQVENLPPGVADNMAPAENGIPDPQMPRKRAQRPSVAVEPLPESSTWDPEPVRATDCEFDRQSAQAETASSTAVATLQDQTDDLQRQIAEFKTAAEAIQQAAANRPEPLNNTIKELTEQVSAIRDFAAGQQDRMRKLQDGYDWGIIRTFCLRVIRCVDNIDCRIQDLTAAGETIEHLEEVRDELLFALESSGVEPFEPQFGSEYRGQEKCAEAVKEKQTSGRPDQAGTIAKVLRPGYRYVMDEENFKIVRTAQVMLFGCEHE